MRIICVLIVSILCIGKQCEAWGTLPDTALIQQLKTAIRNKESIVVKARRYGNQDLMNVPDQLSQKILTSILSGEGSDTQQVTPLSQVTNFSDAVIWESAMGWRWQENTIGVALVMDDKKELLMRIPYDGEVFIYELNKFDKSKTIDGEQCEGQIEGMAYYVPGIEAIYSELNNFLEIP